MTDGKEWVSIKIPESIRDPARDDPRTYGQIMQAGLENEPFTENGATVDVDELADQIRNQLDVLAFNGALTEDDVERIESSLATIEERTGKLERMLEDLR